MEFSAVELIERKRSGRKLSPEAIAWLIDAYTEGSVADYQMSAMAMAILWRGLDDIELGAWTSAMLHSGHVLDLSEIPLPKVDKHSTGGVGDKISIPLAPLVASCGVAVPMMSGRGLGHTGGTLDKLEAIPGFTTRLDEQSFKRIVLDHHLAMAGQSETIAPADKKLYALRDSTGTVPSIPLISSSIMSKKLAEGLDGLVLDVKTGSGAFMSDLEGARDLARTMVSIGEHHDVETVALITSMDQPLGYEIGNANEIRESVAVLRGEGPDDVTQLTLALGEVMLEIAGVDGGRSRLEDAIADGQAFQKLVDVTRAHGGDADVLEDPSLLELAPLSDKLVAGSGGHVTRCDALTIGLVATRLGAGRETMDDEVDHGVGITLHAKIGDAVSEGDHLATIWYRDQGRWDAQRARLESAWTIADHPVDRPVLILDRIDAGQI